MKTKSIILVICFMFAFSSISLISQEKSEQKKKTLKTTKVQKTSTKKATNSEKSCCSDKSAESTKTNEELVCPVMNMAAKKDINFAYNRKTYYFCCNDCLEKFKKEPEKYIKSK